MLYIEAIEEFNTEDTDLPYLFLGGGISSCPNWQKTIKGRLSDEDIALVNPRRDNFPIDDPTASEEQIKWEHDALRACDAILFWFPRETLCPITLYELGAWTMTGKSLFVGTDPEYKRRLDVIIQTKLERPDIEVVDNLDDLVEQVNWWI